MRKKNLFWTNKKFVYLIFIPNNVISSQSKVTKYRTKEHEQVLCYQVSSWNLNIKQIEKHFLPDEKKELQVAKWKFSTGIK